MKLKDGFLLRRVAGQNVVLPIGDDLDQEQVITLNDTGAFLWELLEQDMDAASLSASLRAQYGIDQATADDAVVFFVNKLRSYDFLEA